jgi:hypothetical protein
MMNMDIPWMTRGKPEPGQQAFIMASRFEVSPAWRGLAFLLHAVRVWRQALRSPGLLGVSLRAQLLRNTYWTLSAWTGEPALREFMRTDPHRTVMRKVRPWAKTATFRFWDAAELDPEALWASAEKRIADGGPAQ